MKKSLSLLIFFYLFACEPQPTYKPPIDNKKTDASHEVDLTTIRGDLEFEMLQLQKIGHNKNSYRKFVDEYNEIVYGINNIYYYVAQKIGNDYFTRRDIIQQTAQINKKLKGYSDKAEALEKRVSNYRIKNTNPIVLNPRKNTLSFSPSMAISIVTTLAILIERNLKMKSCIAAKNFYDEVRWRNFKEITTGKKEQVSYREMLGERCFRLIREDEMKD